MKPFSTTKAAKLKTVQSQLPYKFEKGTQLCEIVCNCTKCGRQVPADLLRGQVFARSKQILEVRAIGYCTFCAGYNKYECRVNDDLQFVKINDNRFIKNLIPFLIGVAVFIYLYINY